MKLAPSVRNYDRVMLPSSPQPQQQSGKARPSRRVGKRPSTQEVFALGAQNPAADSCPSPNGSADLSPSSSAPNTGKHSSKKGDKTNGARCLRGRPPELQTCYFVADDVGSPSPSGVPKTAKNDPFWDPSEAPPSSSPRRVSIADAESTSFFKPLPISSKENLASTNSDGAGASTPDVQLSCVLLPPGDIGSTSTDQ